MGGWTDTGEALMEVGPEGQRDAGSWETVGLPELLEQQDLGGRERDGQAISWGDQGWR